MENWFVDLIKRYEGFRSKAYWDVDHYSIGYGSDTMPDGTPVKKDSTITEAEAVKLIPAYIQKKEKYIKKYIPNYDSLPEQARYALIDQLYRGGQGAFSKSPKFVQAVVDGYSDGALNMEEAKRIIKELDIDKSTGGAKDRKQRRAAMLLGVYNPEHNNTVYDKRSPYLQFNSDFTNPASMWGQVVLNKYRDQNFITRLQDPNRDTLDLGNGQVGTHKMSYAEGDGYDIVYPNIQETKTWIFGSPHLVDFTGKDPLKHAIQNGDTIHVPAGFGETFTTQYKRYYPGFNKNGGTLNYLNYLKNGKKIQKGQIGLRTHSPNLSVTVALPFDRKPSVGFNISDNIAVTNFESPDRNHNSNYGIGGSYNFDNNEGFVYGNVSYYNNRLPSQLQFSGSKRFGKDLNVDLPQIGEPVNNARISKLIEFLASRGRDPKKLTSNDLAVLEKRFHNQSGDEVLESYDLLTGLFKSGGGIHIKKSNKGKFTNYCKGKVTEECIEKGKHSSSAAVRKRAVFAENARKWKH